MEEALKSLFKRHFSEEASVSSSLPSHGSSRKLFRLKSARRSVIGAASADRQENAAFLGFSRHFRSCGLSVPEIYAAEQDKGIYLEEDLGDLTLFDFLTKERSKDAFPEPVLTAYRQVVSALPKFQVSAGKTLDYSLCYPRSSFDEQSIRWDLNYFKYYFLRLAKIPFHEQALEDDFKTFSDFLLEADRDFFLYRDFQSRNVMLQDGKPWFIDYQGGRKGALQYDVASLLFDAKADIPYPVRDELLELYLTEAAKHLPIDRAEFLRYWPGFVLIRILQAMGAYGLRGFYERKTHFLQSIPYAVRNIEQLLRTMEIPVKLPALGTVLRHITASSYLRQFGNVSLGLTVRIQSFSYKEGVPSDEKGHGGGFVFDCRALPNPGRLEMFAKLTGTDPEVAAFLGKEPSVDRFLNNVYALIDGSVENYRGRNFTDLQAAFGCTGGRHRSVYCAERLADHLREKYGVAVELHHREREAEGR